jgi:hypothetical protein
MAGQRFGWDGNAECLWRCTWRLLLGGRGWTRNSALVLDLSSELGVHDFCDRQPIYIRVETISKGMTKQLMSIEGMLSREVDGNTSVS